MAQLTRIIHMRMNERSVEVENVALAIPEALTTALELEDIGDTVRMGFEVLTGAQAFDQFSIDIKFHHDGAYQAVYNAAGDFTTPAGLLVGASGDLVALAAATAGWFIMETRGLYAVRIRAACANVAGTTTNFYARAG